MNRQGFIGGSDLYNIMQGNWHDLWLVKTGRKSHLKPYLSCAAGVIHRTVQHRLVLPRYRSHHRTDTG